MAAIAKPTPQPPADAELRQRLGATWPVYRALLDAAADLRPEWKYYGPKYGWNLKLFKGSRNLCFLNHYQDEFLVAFRFGERAVPRVLASGIPQALKDEFMAAKPYVEGRPLRLKVRAAAELPAVLELLDIKRQPSPRERA
ncbi:MAG: DUF3788 family protein [Gemmatimonadetes bacterium]|nr:DUF3788 family protein [Gemmatimonadota bacterium]